MIPDGGSALASVADVGFRIRVRASNETCMSRVQDRADKQLLTIDSTQKCQDLGTGVRIALRAFS